MIISEKSWSAYLERLRRVNDKAASLISQYIQQHDITTKDGHTALLEYVEAVVGKYSEGAAEAACEMYDAIAEASGKVVPPAEPAPAPTFGDVAKTINGTMKHVTDPDGIGASCARLVKRTGVDTTMQNAIRDGAEWAWVPHGDTCVFCLTLASNGWQKASKKALKGGHAEHIHANCDCTYAIRFDSRDNVAGYDPDALYEQYMNAGDNRDERLRNMQHEYAQKRSGKANEVAASGLRPLLGAYIPNAKVREEMIKRGLEEEKAIFADGLLGRLAKGLPPKEGWYDVTLHGWPNHVEFFGQKMDVETLCAIIAQRKDYKKGTPIRLISCYTGSVDDGVAQYVANKLHVDVEAPDKQGIISYFFGKYEVYSGSKEGIHDGEMRVFHPDESKVITNEKGTSRVYY